MEVKIGVIDSPRELVVSSDQTADEVESLVSSALGGKADILELADDKGHKYLVQAAKIAYVEIGPTDPRKVGFGAPTA